MRFETLIAVSVKYSALLLRCSRSERGREGLKRKVVPVVLRIAPLQYLTAGRLEAVCFS
jgi:hypothetical protein